ncbi:MAG TPA: sulfurtransferase [Polyangiaceae bacterium]|jgi:thiosulfate/3-mercaptopyruvate sulfurtransferase
MSARESVVVSTDWLAAHLEDARLRVVDIRGEVRPPGTQPRYRPKREDYDAGHVPGAVFVDWTRDIVDPLDPVPAQIAQPAAFAAKMAGLGIGDDTLVVAYDDHDHIFAGRLSWALRYYGHDSVRVLDGGWTRWVAEGRPTSRDVPSNPPAVFTPRPRPALRKTADDVARELGKDDVLLLDARPGAQYEGSISAASRAGHIPGARNVPYASLVDPATGRFLPEDALARAFAAAGVDVAKLPANIVVYCNGGISCTVPLHALQMLGRSDVSVYDGSWNEWGNDDARPVTRGREP